MRPWPTVTAESGAMFATVRHRTLDAIIISASPKTSNCPTRGCRKIKPLRPAEAGGFRQPACIFSKERDEGEFPGRGFSWLLHSLEDRIRIRCVGRKNFAKKALHTEGPCVHTRRRWRRNPARHDGSSPNRAFDSVIIRVLPKTSNLPCAACLSRPGHLPSLTGFRPACPVYRRL